MSRIAGFNCTLYRCIVFGFHRLMPGCATSYPLCRSGPWIGQALHGSSWLTSCSVGPRYSWPSRPSWHHHGTSRGIWQRWLAQRPWHCDQQTKGMFALILHLICQLHEYLKRYLLQNQIKRNFLKCNVNMWGVYSLQIKTKFSLEM